ncbi:MAG TPA: Asp23/Gls24 family envelope stress response protein, partial [Solirubrobacterales bacterium]|nr:Asp23/Gls24 family envelope stress response protein [Solirubrobacterales bacterium]
CHARGGGCHMTADLEPHAPPDAGTAPDVVVSADDDDALVLDAQPLGPASEPMELTVGRGVIVEVARLAALEVPEVLRVARRGPPWRAALAGPPIMVRVRKEGIELELRVIARPGADLVSMGRHVRDAVGQAVEKLLGQTVRSVTVLVDGVGG